MRFRMLSAAAVSVLVLSASGCELFTGPVCSLELVYGISVTVEDSLTGVPSAAGAQLIARDGAYADTVTVPASAADADRTALQAAGERPGLYTVTVTKAGFLPWERRNVFVTAGECHVRTVHLTARLQPMS